MIVSVITMVVF